MDDRIAKAPPAGIAIDTNIWTAPFWEAAARHELVLPRCGQCGRFRMPPTPFCPECRSQVIEWVEAPGPAILYSYTVVERAVIPEMADGLPYVPAVVEYPHADRVRLISNIVGSPLGLLEVDVPLMLDWHDLGEGHAVPVYRIHQ
jgi:uncharacterized protein